MRSKSYKTKYVISCIKNPKARPVFKTDILPDPEKEILPLNKNKLGRILAGNKMNSRPTNLFSYEYQIATVLRQNGLTFNEVISRGKEKFVITFRKPLLEVLKDESFKDFQACRKFVSEKLFSDILTYSRYIVIVNEIEKLEISLTILVRDLNTPLIPECFPKGNKFDKFISCQTETEIVEVK